MGTYTGRTSRRRARQPMNFGEAIEVVATGAWPLSPEVERALEVSRFSKTVAEAMAEIYEDALEGARWTWDKDPEGWLEEAATSGYVDAEESFVEVALSDVVFEDLFDLADLRRLYRAYGDEEASELVSDIAAHAAKRVYEERSKG